MPNIEWLFQSRICLLPVPQQWQVSLMAVRYYPIYRNAPDRDFTIENVSRTLRDEGFNFLRTFNEKI